MNTKTKWLSLICLLSAIFLIGNELTWQAVRAQEAPSPLNASIESETSNQPSEIIIRLKDNVLPQDAFANTQYTWESIPYLSERLNIYKVQVTHSTMIEALDTLKNNQQIEFAEENITRTATQHITSEIDALQQGTKDSLLASQYSLDKIRVQKAWEKTSGQNTVKIAVLDTGIDGTHKDLSGKIMQGMNFYHENPDTKKLEPVTIPPGVNSDDNGHGTEISGVIAAVKDNGEGIAGICPNCVIVPVKIMNADQKTDDIRASAAIVWAADEKMKVLNLSFGSDNYSKTLELAVQYAQKANVILVAASGNENKNQLNYPAAYPGVISVGATNESNKRCDENDWGKGFGSNYGTGLEVVAPGNNVVTTGNASNTSYVRVSGTSIATPQVVGMISLLLSIDQSLTFKQVMKRIELSAASPENAQKGWTSIYGFGLADAYNVLTADTKAPVITVKAAQGQPLPPKAKFTLNITDDIEQTNVSQYVSEIKSSSIKKLTTQFDDTQPQNMVIPSDNAGDVTASITSDVPLEKGTHKLIVTIADSSDNPMISTTEFTVDPNTTPINEPSPTPNLLTPSPNTLVVEVVKSSNFNLYDSTTNQKFMVPVENVQVTLVEKNLSRTTNSLGKVYFENLSPSSYTIRCMYLGEQKEQTITLPQEQYLKLSFALTQDSKTIQDVKPAPNPPSSGMETSTLSILSFAIGLGSILGICIYKKTKKS
ncbi:MAG: S8 family serine peptidase [bacterium]